MGCGAIEPAAQLPGPDGSRSRAIWLGRIEKADYDVVWWVPACGLAKWVRLRRLRVFIDQPAENRVRGVCGDDCRQVRFAGDEHPISALPPGGAHPALSEGVCAWGLRRRLDHLHARRGEYGVEGGGELGIAVA
jgi:hypothetical protein